MAKAQLIYIAGDLHGEWGTLNRFLNSKIRQSQRVRQLAREFDTLEIIILQTGDFGYWPHKQGFFSRSLWWQECIKSAMPGIWDGWIKIYWCDGNHENHDALDALEGGATAVNPEERFIEIMPGVYFAPFGSVLRLLDGTTVLFCGGAESTDKRFRTPGDSWWPQETIDEQDMASLPAPGSLTVDWVISHTCPSYFSVQASEPAKSNDPSKLFLNRVFDIYHPKRWYFGHYHDYQQGDFDGCSWTVFDYCDNPRGGKWIEEVLLCSM
jgi:DNA repair exonuclease SbcCD nuclease subunit